MPVTREILSVRISRGYLPYLIALLSLCIAQLKAEDFNYQTPNIIFIVADDLGWADINSFDPLHRNYYETPNLDNLARQGIKFLQCYANPTCTPTRAALFSGQYYPNQPVYDVGRPAEGKLIPAPNTDILPSEKVTIAEALKTSNYHCAFMGKWHIGNPGRTGPLEQGFDLNIGGYSAGNPGTWPGGYFEPNNNKEISDAREGEFLTNYLSRKAVEFIRNYKDPNPFYLHLSYFAVHVPLQAPNQLIEKYTNKQGTGGHDNPTYASMIELLDRGVGQVIQVLEETRLTNETLVIFYSDNGGRGGYPEPEYQTENRDVTNNAPLRSGKASFYEGGIRVPLILRWPGVIPPNTQSTRPVHHIDFYPTIIEIARARSPETYTYDGESFVPFLKNPSLRFPERNLFWHYPGYTEVGIEKGPQSVVRSGDWKLFHFYEDDRIELYNLRYDLSESVNLSNTEPIVRDSLRLTLQTWLENVNAPMPQAKQDI